MKIFRNTKMQCGEGPLWQKKKNRLLWVDSDSTFVYAGRLDADEIEVLSDDIPVSSVALTDDGYMLLGDGIWKMYEDGRNVQLLHEFDGEELYFNDSVVGSDGAVYAGTYYWDAQGMRKYGKLYRIAKNGDVRVLDEGIVLSNGLAFSPDHTVLYYSDSAQRCIYQYDFSVDRKYIKNKRIFVRSHEGIPDGITVDSEGYIWCAMWYEGKVYRFDADGRTERVYEFPAKQISSVTFGGPDMSVLFVTSASSLFQCDLVPPGFDVSAHMGGEIYCERTEIVGIPEHVADV